MEIKHTAVSGTVESSDIMITIAPNDTHEIKIDLESSVEKQFGNQIRKVIKDTLANLGVDSVDVTAVDKGALDCTVQARTINAVHRAADVDAYDWKEIDSWNA
ncbi:citrate lyase acyl carrier protein [Floricoccus tropicus]|uniref:Citrate lyase acyl carrier protein n=2 Tax=Floricoccus TaxID=1930830 RepID=A0A1E8GLG0_9LACT|nr:MULTISPECIES: citrate lyase acyl carrier protein [Floricoccus]OFI46486.1 citrate lyase acyl carrier protein [Floricoccus penangensis]OFI48358.1 citrate lyase acyl carrier protein [Floricoccus tropicus]URZ87243.1 citrate lyase acyl carrier protein [Floricoccus penangensis]